MTRSAWLWATVAALATYLLAMYGMGPEVANGVLILYLGLAVYFAPTLVARARGVVNPAPTFVVNLFLGWTFIDWVVALAMAVGARTRAEGRP